MTPERFRFLLDACGADLRRWPEAERDAARVLLSRDAGSAADHREAAMLDRDLDAHRIAPPDAALIERIVAASPALAPRAPASARRLPALWPRAGWALTGVAGALAGAVVVSIALGDGGPAAATDWQKRGTAFTERATDWSEE